MKYQDSWNGKVIEAGKRECALRYEIIKSVCSELKQPFSVCDIGANMNYFGIRLIEDFDCRVMSFEFHQFEMREKLVKGNDRLMFLKRKISLTDMYILNSCCHFDIVLAMSVIHHLPGSVKQWIAQFRKLGDNIIIEIALNDSKRTATRKEYDIPEDGKIIGYGDSHLLKDFKRPIILFK
jgi:hypothetical protein